MKVYVITDGIYSDYHIVAVITDEETAKKYVSMGAGEIEEFETDDFHFPNDLYPYWVKISASNVEKIEYEPDIHDSFYDEYRGGKLNKLGDFIWVGFARSEDHALKIARDYRAKKLAEMFDL